VFSPGRLFVLPGVVHFDPPEGVLRGPDPAARPGGVKHVIAWFFLFQNKQDGKNQGGENKTAQGEIKKRISGNSQGLPHFIAITRVAIAEIKAARAAIRPETATIHVAAFPFFSLPFGGSSLFPTIIQIYHK
jgi:hypothetical protein